MFRSSLKSKDTEEWLDIYFNRPVGLCIALICRRLGVHPNTVTVTSIIFGIAAAVMFCHHDLAHNLCGVFCLMTANFCDSADGQLARLTEQKTLLGRVLDGVAGDVWFICIYAALSLRMMPQRIPFSAEHWGYTIWLLAYVAGLLCHARQSSLSDYYRQIHLFFLFNKGNDELNNSRQVREGYDSLPRKAWLVRLFYVFYEDYCISQEMRTPHFQLFFRQYQEYKKNTDTTSIRDFFLDGSRPLMPFTNILTFNTRAICLYITCLMDQPWIYFVFEILVLTPLYIFMKRKHEGLCVRCTARMNG